MSQSNFLPRFLEDGSSPQCRFRDQQFLTAIKVLLCYKFFLKKHFILSQSFEVRSYIFPGCCCLFRVVLCLYQLLGNMGKWDSLLPESVLKELMLDKLLNRYLMITLCSQALQGNAVCACRKVFTFIIFNVECMYFWWLYTWSWWSSGVFLMINLTLLLFHAFSR